MSAESPALVICGSVISNLDSAYLVRLHSSLVHNPHLADFRHEVSELPEAWSLLVTKEPSLKRVDAAPLLRDLAEWITTGKSSNLPPAGRTSRNTRSTVFTVLAHIIEYSIYLDNLDGSRENEKAHWDAHAHTLKGLRDGGIQGLCAGLLSATAIACSRNRAEISKNAAIAMRLALCVGAVVDLDEAESIEPTVCLSARWPRSECDGPDGKNAESFEAVLKDYPKAYVGVCMDAIGVTISAPKGTAIPLIHRLEEIGALVKQIDVEGRFHYTGHQDQFRRLAGICASLPMFRFPQDSSPQVPLRRNDSGNVVTSDIALHEMVLSCMLVERADWYTTMTRAVKDLVNAHGDQPRALVLGPVDCIPRSVLTISPIQVIRPMSNEALHQSYPDDSIAIIGASCRFPDSETAQEFWDTILAKRPAKSMEGLGSFDCAFFRKSPREAEYMDPQHRLALHLAYEALESSGYFSPSYPATKDVGCYIGMSSGDYQDNVDARPPTAFSYIGTARAFVSGRVSHFFGLTGPSIVVDTACSSSGVAIHTACKALQSAECSMALAGGINILTPEARSHENLAAASFLSPTSQCKPFDASADGYRRGEGGGFVLLKRLSAAVADNDHILGVVAASAVNNSAGTRSITLPSSQSQSQLYRRVLQVAGMQPHQLSYIEAHGTGTKKGDPVECQSILDVFGGRHHFPSNPIHLGSVKGNVGHAEPASGIASLSKVLLMLQHRLIPPQANFTTLNPAIHSLGDANIKVPTESVAWKGPLRTALVNNYGASGANAAMIVCQSPPSPSEQIAPTENIRQYPILIAAHTATSLREYCRVLLHLIETQTGVFNDASLPSIAFHLAQNQNHTLGHRAVFLVRSIGGLKDRLRSQVNNSIAESPKSTGSSNPVVLVFSGQTGRRPRLNYEAYQDSVLLRRHIDKCDRAMQSLGICSLLPRIFNADPVDDLAELHCMLFSLQYSVAKSWIDSGLEIKALVGHSLGQLTSLCVSGVLGLRDALKMISGRAFLIQEKWGPERGCMLSVDADATVVEEISRSMRGENKVEVACYNSYSHQIVVGTEAAIQIFEEDAHAKGVSSKRLAVSHGFHSMLLESILNDYHQIIRGLTLSRPNIPIEPCSKFGGDWASITPELIARQSREPVYFFGAISRIEQRLGPCIWLEAGCGSAGVTMARRALASMPSPDSSSHSFYSTRLHELNPIGSLADTTMSLWNEGIRVQSWMYHACQRCYFKTMNLPPYQFDKSQYWLPFIPRCKESSHQDENELQSIQEAPTLVSPIGQIDPNAQEAKFSINQHSEEYSTLVRGRTVFGQILTPTSVYIEAASRAFNLLPIHVSSASLSNSSIKVEQVKVHAPFGLDPQRQLCLTMRKDSESTWSFTVESHSLSNSENELPKPQASGTVRRKKQIHPNLRRQRPLLCRLFDRCRELREDRNASLVQGPFVKRVMDRVANYSSKYFGIQSIASRGLEAVGEVVMPTIAPACRDGTIFTPPIFDNFLLVAELHASILGGLSDENVYICNGFNTISPQVESGELMSKSEGPWTVFSSMDQHDDKTVLCDIYVFNTRSGTLLLSILGACFKQIPMHSLKRALEAINGSEQNGLRTPLHIESAHGGLYDRFATKVPDLQTSHGIRIDQNPESDSETSLSSLSSGDCSKKSSGPSSDTSPSPVNSDAPCNEKQSAALFSLLAEHLDFSQGISPDAPLGEVGLDSLVAIQLQSDITKAFGKRPNIMMIDETTTFSNLCAMILHQDLV